MIDFSALPSPVLFKGNCTTAYRDPAVFYFEGTFYFFFTLVETEADGKIFMYLGTSSSRDLKNFTPVRKITPKNPALNFSSPGNVVRVNDKFIICCQTYCRENGEKYGNENSRIWTMESNDLISWNKPQMLKVKGDIPVEDMGRMIDPYLIKAQNGKWFCFFKQNGVSFSRSDDLINWEFCGSSQCGENVCILCDNDKYLMWHSPHNGVGKMVSHDLIHWEDTGELITLGQENWQWAKGRLTAGMVIDLRKEPDIGKALLFFHGTGPEKEDVVFDQYACIGFAWSDDLENWDFVK